MRKVLLALAVLAGLAVVTPSPAQAQCGARYGGPGSYSSMPAGAYSDSGYYAYRPAYAQPYSSGYGAYYGGYPAYYGGYYGGYRGYYGGYGGYRGYYGGYGRGSSHQHHH